MSAATVVLPISRIMEDPALFWGVAAALSSARLNAELDKLLGADWTGMMPTTPYGQGYEGPQRLADALFSGDDPKRLSQLAEAFSPSEHPQFFEHLVRCSEARPSGACSKFVLAARGTLLLGADPIRQALTDGRNAEALAAIGSDPVRAKLLFLGYSSTLGRAETLVFLQAAEEELATAPALSEAIRAGASKPAIEAIVDRIEEIHGHEGPQDFDPMGPGSLAALLHSFEAAGLGSLLQKVGRWK